METTRQNKIARLIQKELSEIFLLQTKSMPGVLVSVSIVRISPDMSYARDHSRTEVLRGRFSGLCREN